MSAITLAADGPAVERWTGPGAPPGPMWLHDLTPAPDHPAAVAGPGDHAPQVVEADGNAVLHADARAFAGRPSSGPERCSSRANVVPTRAGPGRFARGPYRLALQPRAGSRPRPGRGAAGAELSVGGATMRGWVRVAGCCTSTWTRSTRPSSSSPVPRCATGRCWSAGSGRAGWWPGASYQARVFGARSAMPMGQARRLCPHAVVLPPRVALYSAVSEQVMAVLAEAAPVVEPVSLDEAFLEPPALAGASPAEVVEFGTALRAAVRARTGLPASVGAGSGKQLAKIASELAKPDGLRVVAPDEEQQVLAPLPVRALWGVGPVAEAALHRLGVRTVGALAALDLREATDVLGVAMGTELHRLARGIDDRPVAPRGAAKQVSAETTFDADLTTMTAVHDAVARITESAHRRLLSSGRAARTVTVKIRSADFTTHTRSETAALATTNRTTLTAVAQRLARGAVPEGGVRLIGVSLAGLGDEPPPALFDDEPARARRSRRGRRRGPRGRHGASGRRRRTRSARPRPRPRHRARPGWRPGDDVTTPSTGTAGCRAPGTAASPYGSRPAAPVPAAPAPSPRTIPPCAPPTRSAASPERRHPRSPSPTQRNGRRHQGEALLHRPPRPRRQHRQPARRALAAALPGQPEDQPADHAGQYRPGQDPDLGLGDEHRVVQGQLGDEQRHGEPDPRQARAADQLAPAQGVRHCTQAVSAAPATCPTITPIGLPTTSPTTMPHVIGDVPAARSVSAVSNTPALASTNSGTMT